MAEGGVYMRGQIPSIRLRSGQDFELEMTVKTVNFFLENLTSLV